jgi:hypothetical protein
MQALGVVCGALVVVSAVVLHYTTGAPTLVMVSGIIGGSVVGLLFYVLGRLVAAQSQVLQVTLDGVVQASPCFTPAHCAEILALHAPAALAPRPQPLHAPAPTRSARESAGASAADAARRGVLPHQAPTQPLSIKAAAHAIGVTRGTMKGYIKSGRVAVNADGTIDLAALSQAGFIIRNAPLR